MAAFIIFEVDVKDHQSYAKNRDLIQPTLDPYGGKFLIRGGRVECLEGTWNPERLVIVEFPNVEKAKKWWASDTYSLAKKVRQESTDTNMILVEGV